MSKKKVKQSENESVRQRQCFDNKHCEEKPLLEDQKWGNAENMGLNEQYIPTDWDESLPFGGKIALARGRKPDSMFCVALQVLLICSCVALLYFAWYYTEVIHHHTTKFIAHLGHGKSQSLLGHQLLHDNNRLWPLTTLKKLGNGVDVNQTEAMKWLYKAAKKGDPYAAYNVAIAHMQGFKTRLKPREARRWIEHAAHNGVAEAMEVLTNVCSRGKCDV